MFDERGRGLILRGAKARTDKGDKHPYLARSDAFDLVRRSITAYRREHQHSPARLVILKTSRFQAAEAEGMLAAAEEADIPQGDLVWISEGGHQMLVRGGDYPPMRGTAVQLGTDLILYTRGSVPLLPDLPRHAGSSPIVAATAPLLRHANRRSRPRDPRAHEDELEHDSVRPGTPDPDPGSKKGGQGSKICQRWCDRSIGLSVLHLVGLARRSPYQTTVQALPVSTQ